MKEDETVEIETDRLRLLFMKKKTYRTNDRNINFCMS